VKITHGMRIKTSHVDTKEPEDLEASLDGAQGGWQIERS
jgi:hypothetical protein